MSTNHRQFLNRVKMELEKLFLALGFGTTQLTVYSTLAQHGKASATQIAKKTKLPRSTVYSTLESLIPSGLVSLDESKTIRYFIANPPEALTRFFDRRKDELQKEVEKQQQLAQTACALLRPFFQNQIFSIPRIQFFEGEANVSNLLFQYSTEWQKSIAQYDSVWWGYQDHYFVEHYREWLDYYWESMLPNEQIKLLSNKSIVEKKLKNKISRRTIKIIPKQFEFSSTIWVLGDYIVSISTRHKPHYAFQIKDSAFASNLRILFQMHWASINP